MTPDAADCRRSGPSSHQPHTAPKVLDALGLGPGSVFVDLGCGPGDYALDAAGRVGPKGAVLALDTWSRVLTELRAEAVRRGLASLLPMRVDITLSLPVATHRIDACLLAMVLHMPGRVAQLGLMLDEARRVLRPGGRLGVLEHAGYDQLPETHPARRLTPEWLTALAESHGFVRCELLELDRMWLAVFASQPAPGYFRGARVRS
ncbi:methyltransferase domain-containing protein [Desulfomicrobium sp. ZS1]|uniref:methyltransferase domain-containing protein n=1 Tax=Desulfomicrobium sp. ZS1 TaxID=2952228 RepID=UPI0020B3A7A7|nr:methyltransferase domain-containing protein [Desulfomicrobium sp. ZS1]UTF51501.1 methyltransferase domain-containing protein [Desulfomicrobium sp. ZS1]